MQDHLNREKWAAMVTSRGEGLILKSIKIDYKFVWLAIACPTHDDLQSHSQWLGLIVYQSITSSGQRLRIPLIHSAWTC